MVAFYMISKIREHLVGFSIFGNILSDVIDFAAFVWILTISCKIEMMLIFFLTF